MPLRFKFDNEISVMDMFAICVALLGCGASYWALDSSIDLNARDITHVKEDVARIESDSEKALQAIIVQIKDQRSELKEFGQEAIKGQRRLEDKLDRFIERDLDKR